MNPFNNSYQKKKQYTPIILMLLTFAGIILILSIMSDTNIEDTRKLSDLGFYGSGTEEAPYLIENVEDLILFRDYVNEGNDFMFSYFRQTNHIDLSSIDSWTPIGIFGSDKYFYGNYDGGGYTISNLNINGGGNVGFFGLLAGKVSNLGIESGLICGSCVGSIASHGTSDALIFNCYNKATVYGAFRAGGIADNFGGSIMFSFNFGEVIADREGSHFGLMSYTCRNVDYCYSTVGPLVAPEHSGSLQNSETIIPNHLTSDFLSKRSDAMHRWSILKAEDANKLIALNGTLHFVADSKTTTDEKYFETKLLVLIILVVLFTMMAFDYILNIKDTISSKHRTGA